MKKHYVFYHAPCSDGSASAWAAKKGILLQDPEAEVVTLPLDHADPVWPVVAKKAKVSPVMPADAAVWFVDITPTEVFMASLPEGVRVMIIDHHAGTMHLLEKYQQQGVLVVFDMSRSGAGLCWDWFVGGPRPQIIDLIEDRDLWRWSIPRSQAILRRLLPDPPDTLDVIERLANLGDHEFDAAAAIGEILLSDDQKQVRKLAMRAQPIVLPGGLKGLVVNSADHINELGHALADKAGVGVVWFAQGNLVRVSFRSTKDVSVIPVAQAMGGNGHQHASGATISMADAIAFGIVEAA